MKKRTICLLISCIACLCLLTACSGKSLNMQDYASAVFDGLDTRGAAVVTLDYDKIADKVLGQVPDLTSGEQLLQYTADRAALEMALQCQYDQGQDLSNGDTFHATVQVNEEKAKELGFSVKDAELQFTVEGLREPVIIDAFQDVEVKFVGCAPYAETDVLNNSQNEFLKYVDFVAEPSKGLNNGDTVTVTAHYSEGQAEEYGYVLQSDTKEYTVEGLDVYVTEFSQIDKETLTVIEQQGKDLIEGRIARSGNRFGGAGYHLSVELLGSYDVDAAFTCGDLTTAGYYLLNRKGDGFGGRTYNTLVAVFQAPLQLKSSGTTSFDGTAYFSVPFYDLVRNTEGKTVVDLSKGQYDFDQSATSLDRIYQDQVMPFTDNYYVEEALNSVA